MHPFSLRIKKYICCLLISGGALTTGNAVALSPEFEADRLLLLTEEAIDDNKYLSAQQSLGKIDQLGLTPPIKYYYLKGLVLANDNRSLDAIEALEQYVEGSGKSAEYYYAALSLISAQKEKVLSPSDTDNAANKAAINWTTSETKNDSYSEQIKYLYQIKDERAALVRHANNILKTYTVTDTSLPQNRYYIGFAEPGKLTTTTKSFDQNVEQVQSDTTVVYGIDPYILHNCVPGSSHCTLYHPVTKQSWLAISNDQQAARELSKALGALIKALQSNS